MVVGFLCPVVLIGFFALAWYAVKYTRRAPRGPRKKRKIKEKCVDMAINNSTYGTTKGKPGRRLVYQDDMMREQARLKTFLIKDLDVSGVNFGASMSSLIEGLFLVAGLDISFDKTDSENRRACAALSVHRFPSLEPQFTAISHVDLDVPYRSGFLGFREVPAFERVWAQHVRATRPQIVLIDGNGLLHPRRFGPACQAGLALDVPTVGIAKQLLCTDGLSPDIVRRRLASADFTDVCGVQVKVVRLHSDTDEAVLGAAVLQQGLKKPIYVSAGHRMTLTAAIKVAVATSRYRIPEPVRQADIVSRKEIREAQDRTAPAF